MLVTKISRSNLLQDRHLSQCTTTGVIENEELSVCACFGDQLGVRVRLVGFKANLWCRTGHAFSLGGARGDCKRPFCKCGRHCFLSSPSSCGNLVPWQRLCRSMRSSVPERIISATHENYASQLCQLYVPRCHPAHFTFYAEVFSFLHIIVSCSFRGVFVQRPGCFFLFFSSSFFFFRSLGPSPFILCLLLFSFVFCVADRSSLVQSTK